MENNMKLVELIYKDSEMASYTITRLLKEIDKKDNKIKNDAEDILKGYERYFDDSKKLLEKENVELKENGFVGKMGATMGIKKEVINDNSDSSIADMLIRGIAMGKLDIEKEIKNSKDETNSKYMKLAKDFLKFQEETSQTLEKYL